MIKLIALVLALVVTQAQADLAFKGDGIDMRLLSQKCSHPKVLALLRADWVPRFRQVQLNYQGRDLQMCWMTRKPGTIVIVDEDGDAAEVPASAFKEVPTS